MAGPLILQEYLETYKQIALERGGRLVSERFLGSKRKHVWECAEKHIWETTPISVKYGSWCRFCNGSEKITIQRCIDLALKCGWKCLSLVYDYRCAPMIWECEYKHQWEASYNTVREGTACVICSQNKKSQSRLDQIREIAANKGGVLLSDTYIHSHVKLSLVCDQGHNFHMSYKSIMVDHWCGICAAGTGERICLSIFEQLFGDRFFKTRPATLLNLKGNRLELDGYCKNLALAFEYQGRQHYEEVPIFNTVNSLEEIQIADQIKTKWCSENNISLFIIPHWIPFDDLPKFISDEARFRGFITIDPKHVDVKSFVSTKNIEKMQELAAVKGGSCLSKNYISSSIKLDFECAERHVFSMRPACIVRGQWCSECHGTKKHAIEIYRQIASDRKGKCLSTEYVRSTSKLEWQCELGHTWYARPSSVKGGTWCQKCSHMKK